ncbi:MAG: ComEC/Rec2 family competence protein [Acidimicrobiales bacterium]
MSDLATVVLALAAAAGAWAAHPAPLALGALVVATALAVRRPVLLWVGVALATSALAARSWAGLHPPATGAWSGPATVLDDPTEASGALRLTVRIGGKRVEAWARGRPAADLADRLAGERVRLSGRLQPLAPGIRRGLAYRHLAAQLTVDTVGGWAPGDPASRLADGIRRTLAAGTASLPPERRALFAGFVLGDSRDEAPEVTDDFRASGLAHLLVVSGENVAFVLGLAGPLLRRVELRWRLVAGLAVLALFGVLTRWEPSVLRAEAMATLGLVAATLGRPASGLRLLALAVTGLLLVDPLLIGSLGFLLSVGACTGIALLAPRFTRAIPGPRPLASALGVSLAAQAGVAPFLVPAFGSIPLATIPANLLAVPAAGPLTTWGMAAGLPAGLAGGGVARVLHLPTGLLLAWVAGVARRAAVAPLGHLRAAHLLVLAAAGLAAAVASATHGRGRRVAMGLGLAVVAAAVVPALAPGPLDGRLVAGGARLWRRGTATVLVLDGATSATEVLAGLHDAEVRRLDVVVAARPGRAAAAVLAPLLRRFPPRLLLAPPGTTVEGASVPDAGSLVAVGPLTVAVDAVAPALAVRVQPTTAPAAIGAPGARSPPG